MRYGTEFPPQPVQPRQSPLDAGPQQRITGPGGISFRMQQNPMSTGRYEDGQRVGLPAPGRYRIDNGDGGRDVGAFSLDTDTVTLRLLNPPTRIVRAGGLTLTWDCQGPPELLLTSFGSSRGACGRELISFSCVTGAAGRRFVVPVRILSLRAGARAVVIRLRRERAELCSDIGRFLEM